MCKMKKILAVVLCLAMIFTINPMSSIAHDNGDSDQSSVIEQIIEESPQDISDNVAEIIQDGDSEESDESDSEVSADINDESDMDLIDSEDERTEDSMYEDGVEAVDFINAAPFLEPVEGKASKKLMKSLSTPLMGAAADVSSDSPEARIDNKNIVTKKWCSEFNEEDMATLTLEAYVTGRKITSTESKDVPADIILVMDQSGSMAYDMNNKDSGSRLKALKSAAKTFVDTVCDKAVSDNVNHRIAIVGFASDEKTENTNYHNTEILTPTVKNYGAAGDVDYKNALISAKDSKQTLESAINNLSASGATYSYLGMDMANRIFAQNPVSTGEKRNRVVVMFTDGEPGYSGFDYEEADKAIGNAYVTKHTYGATVYTIGIFKNADPGMDIFDNFKYEDYGDNKKKVAVNRYMHFVSSNYPEAQSLNHGGDKADMPDNSGYYLSTGNADGLNRIFKSISSQITSGGSDVMLDGSSVVKDVIEDEFELPANATVGNIIIYTAECTGQNENGFTFADKKAAGADIKASIDSSRRTVSVTGFDFAQNYVGMDEINIGAGDTNPGKTVVHGSKLIIEIPIHIKDSCIGGDNLPTNKLDSGIYDSKNECMEQFEIPKVNIPQAEINYVVVGGVGGEVSLSEETVREGKNSQVSGSTATESEGYEFVGWFDDETCKENSKYATENIIKPVSRSAKYYAKFERCLSTLTIHKSGMEPGENAVFQVCSGDDIVATVTIPGNDGSATVSGVTIGEEYTVKEVDKWSWKYAGTDINDKNSVTISSSADRNKLSFQNTPKRNGWLNAEASAKNIWSQKAVTREPADMGVN